MLGLHTLELDRNFFTGCDVGAEKDVSERAAADLSSQSVLVANPKLHLFSVFGFLRTECLLVSR